MTKEELEKEAIKASDKKCVKGCSKYYRYGFQDGYLAGAEPREKQIEIDARQIRALQKQNGELTDKVKKLEAQIEKMKCCGNCAKNGHICVAEEMQGKLCGKNKDKWELRR